MNTVKMQQIPHRKYANEFRQIRKLYSLGDSEIIVLKSILSKKSFIALQKDLSGESECSTILRQLASNVEVYECKGISKLIGYVNAAVWDSVQCRQVKRLVLIFEFGSGNLETIVHSSKGQGKQQTAKLIAQLMTKMLDVLEELQARQIDLSYVLIDQNTVTVQGWQEVCQQLKLTYIPFKFINEGFLSIKNFASCVYSAAQLERINFKERRSLAHSNSQSRSDLWNGGNRAILQKIGLLLTKIVYRLNSEVLLQPQFSLYAMNGEFNIDLNWAVIKQLLDQCSKLRGYASVIKAICFMIEGCKEESSFSVYRQTLFENTAQSSTQQRKYHQEALLKLKSIEEKIGLQGSSLKYADGGIYRGDVKEGVRSGFGVHYFAEGEIYGGEWRKDEMTGRGFYAFINGQTYEGEVLNGVKEGQGLYKYRNGDYYQGGWHNDLKQGEGELYNAATAEKYVGLFSNNLKSGMGTIYLSNGHRFEGIFANGLKNGEGCMLDEFGRIYLRGCWRKGELEGIVQIFLSNGDYYRGWLKDDKKEGRGIYQYADSTVYEGDFVEDEQTGQCTIRYPNGDRYEGKIRRGLFQGQGKYLYRNSELIYEGGWSEGMAEGVGEYYYCETVNLSGKLSRGQLQSYELRTMSVGQGVAAFADDN